jgi:hypothetical protein
MPIQLLPLVPLCILPVLAGKRVACSQDTGRSHGLLANNLDPEDNCCMADTAVHIAWAITDQLKIQFWTCIKCQNENVTSGQCTKCGFDYKASVLNTAKVW